MRDDKRKHDPDTTVPEDDFWASILNETMAEAEARLEPPKPADEWDALLDDALREARSRMGGEENPPEDGGTAPEESGTLPEEGDTKTEDASAPLTIRKGSLLLDTYRVESDVIGKGGMGAVWKVHHIGWDTELAMKRPKAEAFQTEKQKENFTRECDCWINLGLHPNIVSCYYVRELGGIPTIFSEWMENGDLENHITGGTLYAGSDKEVQTRLLDIAIQFARGLRYAHENNLVHQDVKPDNLLLTKDWEAKVSDFGIARARSLLTVLEGEWTQREYDPNATQMTPSGGMTFSYCSPEQAARQLLTKRTDIYSWAVSVLEMYLGCKPWARRGVPTGPLVGLACRDYFAMCTERPIPEALRELLAKCLEQNPDDRPRDFGAVEAALLDIYKSETGAEYPRPEPKSAADNADSLNNRALSFLDLGRPEEAEALWAAALRQSAGHLDSVFNRALSRWRRGKIDCRDAQWELKNAAADRETLAELAEQLRREEGYTLPLPDGTLANDGIQFFPLGFSEDGMRVCGKENGRDGKWIVWDLNEEEGMYYNARDGFAFANVRLSRDGSCVLLDINDKEGGRSISVMEHESSRKLRDFAVPAGKCFPELSPNNSVLAISRCAWADKPEKRCWQTEFWSMETGGLLSRAEDCALLGFTRDGKTLLYDGEGRIRFGGRPEKPLPPGAPVLPGKRIRREIGPCLFQLSERLGLLEIADEAGPSLLLCDLRRGAALRTITSDRMHIDSYEHKKEIEYLGKAAEALVDEDTAQLINSRNRFAVTADEKWLIWLQYDRYHFPSVYGLKAELWDLENGQSQGICFPALDADEARDMFGLPVDLHRRLKRSLKMIADPRGLYPEPAVPAEYRLCRIEDTAERLTVQQQHDRLLSSAKTADADGNTEDALRLVDEALALPGFQTSPAALRLRAGIGKRLRRRDPVRIVPTAETAPQETEAAAETEAANVENAAELAKLSLTGLNAEKQIRESVQRQWEENCSVYDSWDCHAKCGRISRDGRRLLVYTDAINIYDSPAQFDIEVTHFHGAAVIDTLSGELLWNENSLCTSDAGSDPYQEPRYAPSAARTRMDPSGELLLVRSRDNELLAVKLSDHTQSVLLKSEVRTACLLLDRRFVLCQRMNNSNVLVLNADTGKSAEFPFSKEEYGVIRYIDDDCFAIRHGEQEQLCWIVWDYEA